MIDVSGKNIRVEFIEADDIHSIERQINLRLENSEERVYDIQYNYAKKKISAIIIFHRQEVHRPMGVKSVVQGTII